MLAEAFERARNAGRCAFIPFIVAGDPDIETTKLLFSVLTQAGADIIELGVPYGDPLADGSTIATAAQRACERGVNLATVLRLTRFAANEGCSPIVLFTYVNLVLQYGVERFATDAAAAGAHGVIIPDIPIEESHEIRATLASMNLRMPLMIAPSTPAHRALAIAEASSGFIYIVSRLGVTGATSGPDSQGMKTRISALRRVTHKPLAVGFGISSPHDVRSLAAVADGAIVGSAIIDAYSRVSEPRRARAVQRLCADLISACYTATA
ncbi:MAG: tryptophan synthase subunit alpha [Candidatus Eremiobacteraeota bacterium]|nr:tryptophan synthase subunit alpha [Candidatus Eremiobacteraeota bacterium]